MAAGAPRRRMKTVPSADCPFGRRRPAWLEPPAPPPAPSPPHFALGGAPCRKGGQPDSARVRSPTPRPDTRALERGRLSHRLLQSLPEIAGARATSAPNYLAATAAAWPAADRTALLDEILAVLDDPRFAPVFAPGSRAEVDIAGVLPFGGPGSRYPAGSTGWR